MEGPNRVLQAESSEAEETPAAATKVRLLDESNDSSSF